MTDTERSIPGTGPAARRAWQKGLPLALLTLLCMTLFALNSILCRLALLHHGMDPVSYTAIRMTSGALMLFALHRWRQRRHGQVPDWRGQGSWGAALALFVAVCVVMVAKAYSEEPAAEPAAPEASAAPAAILPTELLFNAAEEEEYMEDPQETEKIEEALLAQGYFSLAVPMPYEWQDYMRTYCEEYGCPYPLALAVAQTESNFDMDAVGASGEVGIMQLNPGPGGSYHAEIQAATGLDPTTASGNIAGGCYKLGLYLDKYGSVEKAAMAYNMGEGGARSAWDSGITSTDYSKAVKEAMERWECTVNAWGGV